MHYVQFTVEWSFFFHYDAALPIGHISTALVAICLSCEVSHAAAVLLLLVVFLHTIKGDDLKYVLFGFGEGRLIVMIYGLLWGIISIIRRD